MSAPPEHSLAPGAGQVDMGPGPGDDQPRKRLRHEDHEVGVTPMQMDLYKRC